ncbi:hypothetical protein A1343_15905 [Leptospira interrogans serovar Bataviae]|nr:hypothetical protein A1343_15905 [Leptospira interrogans serovar Bataviae]QOI40699.1 hypothetical protein Lepto1548_19705 [Leptospira interrogans serovar Bataviae]
MKFKIKIKTYSYSAISLIVLLTSCRFANKIEPKKIDEEKISNTISSKQSSEKQHICYKELDSCFSDCNERFLNVQRTNYISRGKCRDACVATMRETTDCLIFYQSSRK